jgi:hypothetical protein
MSLEDATLLPFFLMDALGELELIRREIQEKIDGYRGTAGYDDDERLRLQLKIACLERDINDIKIALINITNEEERKTLDQERREKEQQIETKKKLLHDLNQLRSLPPQQMQVAQLGNLIFLSSSAWLTFPFLSLKFLAFRSGAKNRSNT